MIDIDFELEPRHLAASIERLWALSAHKLDRIEQSYATERGAPVFTAAGRYQSRGWTEWTQGFQYGSLILQFDATGDERYLELGRERVVSRMAPHLTHTGVHDHGFNNVSTYGNLLRLMGEGRIPFEPWERRFYELGLQVSGAVQAGRWTSLGGSSSDGYIYSFNGPHSLFVDTIRSCRALMLSHLLGHSLHIESDRRISLAERALTHLSVTARYSVYYGEGRDSYDVWGRAAHESLFNVNDGSFRCPSTQQGYSPFSTWTRGLAWAICGFAEELELLARLPDATFEPHGGRTRLTELLSKAARATSDFYIANTPTCGVPYWDTGAPGLSHLEGPLERPADPLNPHEPVDSSAAAIAAQGLLRLGAHLGASGEGRRYWQAGLSVLRTLLGEPYLSFDSEHQGLLLHSVYHRPNGWDYLPPGSRTPRGESSMWGDYHLRELALYVQRHARNEPYYAFFAGIGGGGAWHGRAERRMSSPISTTPPLEDLSRLCVHTITTKPWSLEQAAEAYAAAGVKGITVWRDALEGRSATAAGERLQRHGLRVVSLCRGGFFAHVDEAARREALDDNRRAIDEAAALGAPLVVLVCGAHPGQPLQSSRDQIRRGIEALVPYAEQHGVRLAIEPLHPMYADSRSAINTLEQANDAVLAIGSDHVGVAVDVYHLWWDPALEQQIARSGRAGKLFAFHVCDWKTPTSDLLLDRGLPGEGCIDVRGIRSWVERAGFHGFIEVEIFSKAYWEMDQQEFLSRLVEAYRAHV